MRIGDTWRIPTALVVVSVATTVMVTSRKSAPPPAAPPAPVVRTLPSLDGVYGTVATPGPVFAGITLGASAKDTDATSERISAALAVHGVRIGETNGVITNITIYVREPERCHQLRAALERTWGVPTIDQIWLHPMHARASFVDRVEISGSTDCMLMFDRYLDATDWVDKLPLSTLRDASLPGDDGAVEQLGEHCFGSGGIGLGLGTSPLTRYFVARVDATGAFISVTAPAAHDFESVRVALTARLGAEPTVEVPRGGGLVLRWKRPLAVTAQLLDDDIHVTIGVYPSACPRGERSMPAVVRAPH